MLKADLARAVWFRIAASFVPGIIEMLASDASLDDKIDRYVDAYFTRLTRHPYLAAYIVGEAARHPRLVEAFYSPERVKVARRMLSKLREQIGERVKKGSMAPLAPEQLVVTLASTCIFPFAGRPGLAAALALDSKGFDAFLKQRRKELPAFLKRALRP